jgi:Fe-S-cluster containining protein
VSLVRSLSFHAAYRCQRAGACCTSSWPIPVEADRHARLQAALATGALRSSAISEACFDTPPGAPADTPVVLTVIDGRCVFFDDSGVRRCRVHDALGHEALPLACRQFPRVVVRDPRGVSVVLSHYCPTAAGLLGREAAVTIATSPPAFPVHGEYEGLDVRSALPPLVQPDVLMDWDSWWDFERLGVDLLGNSDEAIPLTLSRVARIVDHIRAWRPGNGMLRDRICRAFADDAPLSTEAPLDLDARVEDTIAAIPKGLPVPDVPLRGESAPPTERALRHFLAAHAFASWTAHLGRGLRTWMRSIEAAYALVQSGRTMRQADLILRHLADPRLLAERWSAAETEGLVRRTRRSRPGGPAIQS